VVASACVSVYSGWRKELAMPQSIPPGLTQEHILRALSDLDAGVSHSFGEPTKYELVHQGKRYAPKAVVGVACKYLIGRMLHWKELSSGMGSGQAINVLQRLGFTVVRKGEEPPAVGKDWSEQEVALAVADYFDMLRQELFGQAYSKSKHRKALSPQLAGRSKSSIQFNHANISAVLLSRGLPYINGYKPRGNFQALLAQAVDAFLDQNPSYLKELAESPVVNPDQAPSEPTGDLTGIFVPAPKRIVLPQPGKPWLSLKGRRIDFALRDATNRKLAELSEEFVVKLERRRLVLAKRDDLAGRVQWASRDFGDGLGFDILSFDEADNKERFLEVKATGQGLHAPFYVTANEVRCSEDVGSLYLLYRVFDFSRAPRVYILPGPLNEACKLRPTQYLAAIRPPKRPG
jgi:hypothetical protein